MAKRKRLGPVDPEQVNVTDAGSSPERGGFVTLGGAPIATIAADASATAALEALTSEMQLARGAGRLIIEIPLDQIKADYLIRDRTHVDDDDMAALVSSIQLRGQQTPIEVTSLGVDQYGLISGWRRLQALKQLAEKGVVSPVALAMIRNPQEASDAYLAMVEENEIRADLSYYERAQIAVRAVEQGVYPNIKAALQQLYHASSRPRRSKIGSFTTLVFLLGDALRFPEAIGERLGLRIAKVLDDRPGDEGYLCDMLKANCPETVADEQALLNELVARLERGEHDVPKPVKPKATTITLRDGLVLKTAPDGSLTLKGRGVTPEFREKLVEWLG